MGSSLFPLASFSGVGIRSRKVYFVFFFERSILLIAGFLYTSFSKLENRVGARYPSERFNLSTRSSNLTGSSHSESFSYSYSSPYPAGSSNPTEGASSSTGGQGLDVPVVKIASTGDPLLTASVFWEICAIFSLYISATILIRILSKCLASPKSSMNLSFPNKASSLSNAALSSLLI